MKKIKVTGKNAKLFLRVLFAIYIVLLLGVVTLRFLNPRQLLQMREALLIDGIEPNLTPFATISDQLQNRDRNYARWNILANTICFMPFGFLYPLITKRERGVIVTVFVGCIFSALIETCQYIFSIGLFDVDDIILNTGGVLIGYIGLRILYHVFVVPRLKRMRKNNM
jgi:glycopeptide antibiotics resistance protein